MSDGPRRSRRRAYVSLAALEARAKAVSTAEEHEAFWGEAAVDEGDDASFDEDGISDESEDEVDSDFDAPEDIDEDDKIETGGKTTTAEAAVRTEERRAARREKTSRYVDPAAKSAGSDKPASRKGENADEGNKERSKARRSEKNSGRSEKGVGARTALRKSTKAASARAAEERERRRKGEEARRQLRAKREAEREPTRPLTQEERLAKARETEIENRESLAELLKMEERKKREPVQKKQASGPMLSLRVRDGKTTISVSEGVDVMAVMFPQVEKRQEQASKD